MNKQIMIWANTLTAFAYPPNAINTTAVPANFKMQMSNQSDVKSKLQLVRMQWASRLQRLQRISPILARRICECCESFWPNIIICLFVCV